MAQVHSAFAVFAHLINPWSRYLVVIIIFSGFPRLLGQCRRPIQKGGYGGICVVVRATRSAFRGIRWICHRWGKRSLSSGWSPACRFQLRGPRRRRGRFPLSRGWQSAGELGINAIFAVKDREQKPAVIVRRHRIPPQNSPDSARTGRHSDLPE